MERKRPKANQKTEQERERKRALVVVEKHERLNTNKYYFWINRMQTGWEAHKYEHVLH